MVKIEEKHPEMLVGGWCIPCQIYMNAGTLDGRSLIDLNNLSVAYPQVPEIEQRERSDDK